MKIAALRNVPAVTVHFDPQDGSRAQTIHLDHPDQFALRIPRGVHQ